MDRKKSRRRLRITGKSLHLPQELIEEIMSAQPAKSLLRYRCVSQSWRCLIDSDKFIKTQLEKSIKDPSYAHWRVALKSSYDRNPEKRAGLKQCSVSSYLDEVDTKINRRPFDDSTNNHLTTPDCDIVGSCNGLLYILKKERHLFLWNPTTRIAIEIPKLEPTYINKYGFGMDEQTGAYKVFAAFTSKHLDDDDEYIGKLYSSKTNSWKTVEHGCLYVEDEAGVLVGGKLHWLMEDGDYIESLDLSSGVFDKIKLPYKRGEAEDQILVVARGMLRVTVNYKSDDDSEERDDMWDRVRVTKAGEKEHWVKVETETDEETKIIVESWLERAYVESLVWPVPLKNH